MQRDSALEGQCPRPQRGIVQAASELITVDGLRQGPNRVLVIARTGARESAGGFGGVPALGEDGLTQGGVHEQIGETA